MKTFAIRDRESRTAKDLAYLIYFFKEKKFYIELPDDADPWEIPFGMDSFLKRGITTIGPEWSRIWVQQRIVPTDRQNLGAILKENGLKEYDEYKLLTLAKGRCAQDSYYIAAVDEDILLQRFPERFARKVEEIMPLHNQKMLVFFQDGSSKECDIAKIVCDDIRFRRILDDNLFTSADILPGGYGICWGEQLSIPDSVLYCQGVNVPITLDDITRYVDTRIVSTSEAADILSCSRQNVNDLVVREKLHPVKTEQKNKFFRKSEILQRLWK